MKKLNRSGFSFSEINRAHEDVTYFAPRILIFSSETHFKDVIENENAIDTPEGKLPDS